MKKIIGYLLNILSLVLFFILALGFLKNIFSEEAFENGLPGFFGFLVSSVLFIGLFMWLNFHLFKYSKKLIGRSNKMKSEIDAIGKE